MPGTRPGMTSFVGKPNSISCILSQTLRMKSTKHSWLICPTGCFAICLSTPVSKNIPLRVLVDAALLIPPSRPTEGRIAIVTDAGRDAMDAGCASDESTSARTAKSCGPDAPTLASSFAGLSAERRWQTSPVTGESAKETVKTIACGNAG
jgi:hypothetical protein